VQEQLAAQGASAMIDKSPDDFSDYMKHEIEKWQRLLKIMGAKAQ